MVEIFIQINNLKKIFINTNEIQYLIICDFLNSHLEFFVHHPPHPSEQAIQFVFDFHNIHLKRCIVILDLNIEENKMSIHLQLYISGMNELKHLIKA
jgi:hypothetical protein